MPGSPIAVIWPLACAGTPLASTTYCCEVGCLMRLRIAADVMPTQASVSATYCCLATGICGGSAVTM